MRYKIAVVIPCFRVIDNIADVIDAISGGVSAIYCVDDACPDGSGTYIEKNCCDSRIVVLYHEFNQGVGGAVITGFRRALKDDMDIVVKIDGDGQMDPSLIPIFVAPIISEMADYAKGNRFYQLEYLQGMPKLRLAGNSILTFLTKLSSGYWKLFDPTNGYIAVHSDILRALPLHRVSKNYFFESDMLYYLSIIRAKVVDIPMAAKYGNEISSLKINQILGVFIEGHLKNMLKRIFYTYYLRDFQVISVILPIGIFLLIFGGVFGGLKWWKSVSSGIEATAGTVMISALSITTGFQMLLSALNYDIQNTPDRPIHLELNKHI